METNLKKKIIIFIFIFGAIVLFLITALIRPLFGEIKKNSKELVFIKEELVSIKTKIKNFERIKEFYISNQQKFEKINDLFVNPEVPIKFIEFLEENVFTPSDLFEFEISSVNLEKSELDPWGSIAFQISLYSSFPDFLRSIEKIENSPYLVKILNLKIDKLNEKEIKSKSGFSEGAIKAILSIKVYASETQKSKLKTQN